ncbi:MAG: hypothetical protein NVS4B3_21710 [Gemmatimonadaceae bacterium]
MLVGLVLAFVAVAITGAIGAAWAAEAADGDRWVALGMLAFFGASLLSTRIAALSTRPLVLLGARIEQRASGRAKGSAGTGVGQPFALGVATGLLWAPCAGPVLGLVVAIAVSGAEPERAAALFALFGAGAATALALALLATNRVLRVLRRVSGGETWARRAVGTLALGAVAAIGFGWDASLLSRGGTVQTASAEEAILKRLAPNAKADAARSLAAGPRAAAGRAESTLPAMPLADYGPLPDFAGGAGWLNGESLGLAASAGTLPAAALRGRVVVVNVWTFECYNCLNALPHIKALETKYRGQDVVVIGVHTPELARERVPSNVVRAVVRLGVTYPNVLDPDYRIWRAFHNEYWPSVYIADRQGRIRFRHFGEGGYGEEDQVVAQLLATPPTAAR